MRLIFSFITFLLTNDIALATCSSLTSGPIEIKVNDCKTLVPKPGSNSYNVLPSWVKDLDQNAKKKLLSNHSGVVLKGVVTESKAVTKGLNETPGALKGTEVNVFVHYSQKPSCKKMGNFVKGIIKETCCDGSGNPPCLWNTGYFLSKYSTSQKSGFSGKTEKNNIMKDVAKLYKAKKYGKLQYKYGYRNHEFKNEVDFQYYLGMSYFVKENCDKAVPFFDTIYSSYGKGKANLAFKGMIKQAAFNLALCHAKDGDAKASTLILKGMKLDKKFFGSEIVRAKSHRDFGRIKNTPEWKEFLSK